MDALVELLLPALLELLLHGLVGAARLAWLAVARPSLDWGRWHRAHAFLARNATRVVEENDALTATFGPTYGSARVVIDQRRGRVRVECAWDGGGLRVPERPLRHAPLPPVLARLRGLPIEEVSSDGRTLVVRGRHALTFELPSLLRALAVVVHTGRRARERLASRPECAGFDVELGGAGAEIVARRPVGIDGTYAFAIDAGGALRSGTAPEAIRAPLGRGPVAIGIASGTATIRWPDVPTREAITRVERALASVTATSPYR